jgi:hypothetical protein
VHEGGPEARARLVIADDHEGTRVLLRTLLSLHPEIEVVGEAENGEEAARLALAIPPFSGASWRSWLALGGASNKRPATRFWSARS